MVSELQLSFLHTLLVVFNLFPFPFSEQITWESYQHVDYTTITRTALASAQPNSPVQLLCAPKLVPPKKQFVQTTAPRAEFVRQFQTLAPKIFRHHQLERVQREAHSQMFDNLDFGHLLIQMDYAENIKLVVREQRYS